MHLPREAVLLNDKTVTSEISPGDETQLFLWRTFIPDWTHQGAKTPNDFGRGDCGEAVAIAKRMAERRSTKDRRRITRHGRRGSDPRPAPIVPSDRPFAPLLANVIKRLTAIEKGLQIQFQRIAQLQVLVNRLGVLNPLRRDRSTKPRH
jgi:hypothetical protein